MTALALPRGGLAICEIVRALTVLGPLAENADRYLGDLVTLAGIERPIGQALGGSVLLEAQPFGRIFVQEDRAHRVADLIGILIDVEHDENVGQRFRQVVAA